MGRPSVLRWMLDLRTGKLHALNVMWHPKCKTLEAIYARYTDIWNTNAEKCEACVAEVEREKLRDVSKSNS